MNPVIRLLPAGLELPDEVVLQLYPQNVLCLVAGLDAAAFPQ